MQEARDEDVRVWQVHLPCADIVEARRDAKQAAPLVVEERGEDARRIDPRRAAPVDRAVGAHEGHRPQVADDAVLFYWQVGHGAYESALTCSRIRTGSPSPARPRRRLCTDPLRKAPHTPRMPDRKSTRLNSSHRTIS